MGGLSRHWPDGRIKFALTRALLRVRHGFADLFRHGTYEPVPVTGPNASHVIAFARQRKDQRLVIAAGRHFAPLSDYGRQWPDRWDAALDLGPDIYEDILGSAPGRYDGHPEMARLFRALPVSVLCRVPVRLK